MRRKIYFCSLLSLILVFVCGIGFYSVRKVMSNLKEPSAPLLIIDAGHGGFDGGATGISGVVEKDINLLIAQKLSDMAQLNGYQVIMVRSTDEAVNEEGLTGIRKQKVSDIHHRVKLANQYPDAVFVSIHQNFFTQEKYWGTQVFYGKKNANSRFLAQKIQDNVRQSLQVENKREIKPAGNNLYILSNISNPAVMVECGFISNREESLRLTQEDYQQQLAFVILQSIIEFQMLDAEGDTANGSEV